MCKLCILEIKKLHGPPSVNTLHLPLILHYPPPPPTHTHKSAGDGSLTFDTLSNLVLALIHYNRQLRYVPLSGALPQEMLPSPELS